jgi:hypothetical protein
MPLRARIFPSCVRCVFWDKLITHAEESGLVRLSNCVWFRSVKNGAAWAQFRVVRLYAKTGYISGSNQYVYFVGASLEAKAVHRQDGLTFSAVLLE